MNRGADRECACAPDQKGDVDGFQQNRVGERIGAAPVPQIWEPIGEVVQLSPQERVQNCTAGADFGFPCV